MAKIPAWSWRFADPVDMDLVGWGRMAKYRVFGTTRDAFGTKRFDAETKRFDEMTTRDAFKAKRFDGTTTRDAFTTKRFDKMTKRNAFGTTRFIFGTKHDAFGTKRFDEMTTRDAFKAKRFDKMTKQSAFGTTRFIFGTKHDAFGAKSFAAKRFSGGIASACSEIGHCHGFFNANFNRRARAPSRQVAAGEFSAAAQFGGARLPASRENCLTHVGLRGRSPHRHS